ncbi:hypothetical protein HPP92_001942 [Vanilla planifolia]|uniref:AAA+ ATPase domain-containing protein n=1 Tax=Vanilla planifolia TaxID=51239 RepID=A0A835S7K8_VANPL|nr:hypothetical protein HPP92_001942 [Vanilla planifolia]
MDRSSNENLLAKRPRRCVQSKLSFSVFSEAGELDGARPPSPTLAAADGRSTSDGGENETKRKRKNTKKPHDGHLKETADSNKEAQKVCSYNRKGNRVETRRSGRKKTSPTKHIDLNSKSCLNSKSDNVKDCNEENLKCCQIFSDLRSEAKKAAEENIRLSAGKQTHPFFSICRATKKPSGTKEIEKQENFSWLALDGDYSVSLPPVHVSEFVKDGVGVPDWKNWKFVERSPTELGGYCYVDLSSVFEGSIKSLSFEAACAKEKELDHFFVDDKMNSEDKSKPFYEPASTGQLHSHFKMDHFGCNICSLLAHVSSVNDQDQYGPHKGRLASYCQRSLCCPDCSLWTDKYRPEISMEVCGNTESVKLLSDWLKSWQERGALNSKNNSIIEYSDGSSYDGGSDIDELVVEDTLKNVLLITGPVGSGKSAAIYACAKEQGFKVIEVNASCLRNGAYMRQTFGEGVDSLGLTNWLAEDETLKTLKHARVLQPGTLIDPEDGCEAHSNEMSPRTCNGEHTPEKRSYGHIANKTLFLFEEVDVVFDEDHGFISAILKLAETTKRPIILTSNNKHPGLPQLLDRLILDFKAPSYTELLSHLSMVCGFEKVHISRNLLERIIKACLGDIRRILILLQFWCQGMGEMAEYATKHLQLDQDFSIWFLIFSFLLFPFHFYSNRIKCQCLWFHSSY